MRRALLLFTASVVVLAASIVAASGAGAPYKPTRLSVEGSEQTQQGERYRFRYYGSLDTTPRCAAARRLELYWIRSDGGVQFATAKSKRDGSWSGEGFYDPAATSLEIVVNRKRLGRRAVCGADVYRQIITG